LSFKNVKRFHVLNKSRQIPNSSKSITRQLM